MKALLAGVLAAAVCVLATLPCAAADTTGADAEGVLRATLGNGLRVVIVPDPLAPVVSTVLNYIAGSNDAPEGFPGTAHAVEHMMFRGSNGFDKDQLAEFGALLGGVYNATTTETVTQYTHTVPSADLGLVLRSEAIRMRELSLTEADWQQERGAIEQEVSRDLSSPYYVLLSQVRELLFEGTPYAHDALGTRPSFDLTDSKQLRQFYEQWYAPNNAILVIAGDIEPAAALSAAEAAFADIPSRALPKHRPIALNPVQPKTLTLPTNSATGQIALAYRVPGLKDKDFAAASILCDVLGSRRGAFYGLVPAGRALAASVDCHASAEVGFALATAGFPKGADPAPLLADMRRIIAEAAKNGVPPDLVEAAKRQRLARFAFESDSISGLGAGWSRALAFGDANSPQDLARAYAAVTVEDVNRLAGELLDPDHSVTAIQSPRSSGEPVTAAGFGGAENFSQPPDHPVTLPSWASSALMKLPAPAAAAPPDVSTLPNGLRLIVHPEHVSHTVSVYGQVRTARALQEPPGQEGVAALTGELFAYGTEMHDRLAFRRAVDDIAAGLGAGFSFSLRVLTPQFEAGMQLLAENELRPAFPPDAFTIVRGQFAQYLAGRRQSPGYLFARAMNRAIVPEDDPTLREATPETVMALQPGDLRAYYASAFRPDLTTIVVIGDITPTEARRVVAATFGDWKATGPTPPVDLPPIGPNPPSDTHVPDASSLQDSVHLSETLALPVNNPDRYKLALGNVILGSGFSSRLYQDLRVKSGYVYNVGSQLNWTRTRTSYTVSFGADQENVDKARLLILRDLNDMQTAPVSEAELLRAKAQMLRRLPTQRASVPAIAASYLHLVDLDLPLDTPEIDAARYLEVTAPQIQQAFAAWMRPDHFAQVVQGPMPTR